RFELVLDVAVVHRRPEPLPEATGGGVRLGARQDARAPAGGLELDHAAGGRAGPLDAVRRLGRADPDAAQPAAERFLRANLVPELRGRFHEGPFELDRRHAVSLAGGARNPSGPRKSYLPTAAEARSGASHSAGNAGPTWPGGSGAKRRASSP